MMTRCERCQREYNAGFAACPFCPRAPGKKAGASPKGFDAALLAAERAIELDSTNAGAWIQKAQALIGLNRRHPAGLALEHVIKQLPNAPAAERVMAKRLHWELEARGRKPDPQMGAKLRQEAQALATGGDAKEALLRVSQSLHYDPFDPDGTLLRARMQAAVGWHKVALDTYTEALELAPASVSIYADRARSLRALGLLEDARVAYDEQMRRAPQDVASRAARAEVVEQLRRQASGEAPTLRRARPHDRISYVDESPLFSYGHEKDGYHRVSAESAYRCPRCDATTRLELVRLVAEQAETRRPSPLSSASHQAFAEVGAREGYDLICPCGVSVRVVYAATELPARSCEFVPGVQEVLELWPAEARA